MFARAARYRVAFFVMAPSAKTYVAKPADRERSWLLVDANGKTLGRLATQIADVLRGKRNHRGDAMVMLLHRPPKWVEASAQQINH